jgi:CBS domain containing-hemolysin-like protein
MLEYALLVLFVLLEGFFSGSETGFYCINRMRLRFRAERNWPGAAALRRLNANPQLAVSTMLVGTNICVYAASVLCSQKLREFAALGPNSDFYAGIVLPPILLIFAENVPKSIYRLHADTIMYKAALPLSAARVVFMPVVFLMAGLGRMIRLLARRGGAQDPGRITADRFRFFLSEGAALGVVSPYQQTVAENILRLKSLALSSAMVPLDNVLMVEKSVSRQELVAELAAHRFSRIPLYDGERSKVVGVVNIIDLLAARGEDKTPQEIARPPVFLDAGLSVPDALYALQRARRQMAIVRTDGRPAGVVTVKDLVEKIVGELAEW